jgi:hypothetical protein
MARRPGDRASPEGTGGGCPRGRYRTLGVAILIFGLGLAGPGSAGARQEGGHGQATAKHGPRGHEERSKETPPETYAVLDLFSEALEASTAGIGVKITELKSKAEDIQKLYRSGNKHQALAKTLGTTTEVVVLGFLIETFGLGEMFVSALSLSSNWLLQLVQSIGGILLSSKAAVAAGDKIEEAVERKYEHEGLHAHPAGLP